MLNTNVSGNTFKEKSICEEAHKLVRGGRRDSYGHPLDNFQRIADLWTVRLRDKLIEGTGITPEDVGDLMILMKVARNMHAQKRDNLVDIAGYAQTLEDMAEERKRRQQPGRD